MSEVKELPNGWKYMKLGDLAKRNTGKVLPSDHTNLKFIGMDCIEPHTLRPTFLYDFKEFKSSGNSFKKNQVLYGRMRPYLNKVFKADFDGACSGEFIVLDCNNLLLPDLLKYILHSRGFVSFANSITTGDRPRISYDEIAEYQIAVAPLPTQAAIVSKIEELFSELDKGIESLRTAQQQLRTYRQSVLKWAFEGRLNDLDVRFPRRIEGGSSNLPSIPQERIQPKGSVPRAGFKPNTDGSDPLPTRTEVEEFDSPTRYNTLPEGWKWVKLSELTKVKDGTHDTPKYVDHGIPFVTQKNIKESGLSFDDTKFITQASHDDFYRRSDVAFNDILISMIGANRGMTCLVNDKRVFSIKNVGLIKSNPEKFVELYLLYFLKSVYARNYVKSLSKGGAQEFVGLTELRNFPIVICTLKEQQQIVEEIERRLTVADKMEESISQSLLQSEALRQSILKMAFEGRLVAGAEVPAEKVEKEINPILKTKTQPKREPNSQAKPKNDHWYKVQLMGYILHYSQQKGISHGEMTLAKYAYLIDKLYDVKTGYKFERGHLGPYSIEMKKIVNDKKFFDHINNHLELKNPDTIFKYPNAEQSKVQNGIKDLCEIFETYPVSKKSHKIELLATVCKVIEDIQSTDLPAVRQSMQEWSIKLKTSPFKNKAEKFTTSETKRCIEFIIKQAWHKKLIEDGI